MSDKEMSDESLGIICANEAVQDTLTGSRVRRLFNEISTLTSQLNKANAELDNCINKNIYLTTKSDLFKRKFESVTQERDRLREALKFYADDDNWQKPPSKYDGEGHRWSQPSKIQKDNGHIANMTIKDSK